VASRSIAPRRVSSLDAAFEEGVESFGDESRQRGPSAGLDVGDDAGRVLLQRRAFDAKPQTWPKPLVLVVLKGPRRQREPSHEGSAVANQGKAAMSSVPTKIAPMAGATEVAT